jgi:hypothetical protein
MKRAHSIAGKGILHDNFILEVLGKKDEPSEFYNLIELMEEFVGKNVTFSIKEEDIVKQAEEDIDVNDNQEEE